MTNNIFKEHIPYNKTHIKSLVKNSFNNYFTGIVSIIVNGIQTQLNVPFTKVSNNRILEEINSYIRDSINNWVPTQKVQQHLNQQTAQHIQNVLYNIKISDTAKKKEKELAKETLNLYNSIYNRIIQNPNWLTTFIKHDLYLDLFVELLYYFKDIPEYGWPLIWNINNFLKAINTYLTEIKEKIDWLKKKDIDNAFENKIEHIRNIEKEFEDKKKKIYEYVFDTIFNWFKEYCGVNKQSVIAQAGRKNIKALNDIIAKITINITDTIINDNAPLEAIAKNQRIPANYKNMLIDQINTVIPLWEEKQELENFFKKVQLEPKKVRYI